MTDMGGSPESSGGSGGDTPGGGGDVPSDYGSSANGPGANEASPDSPSIAPPDGFGEENDPEASSPPSRGSGPSTVDRSAKSADISPERASSAPPPEPTAKESKSAKESASDKTVEAAGDVATANTVEAPADEPDSDGEADQPTNATGAQDAEEGSDEGRDGTNDRGGSAEEADDGADIPSAQDTGSELDEAEDGAPDISEDGDAAEDHDDNNEAEQDDKTSLPSAKDVGGNDQRGEGDPDSGQPDNPEAPDFDARTDDNQSAADEHGGNVEQADDAPVDPTTLTTETGDRASTPNEGRTDAQSPDDGEDPGDTFEETDALVAAPGSGLGIQGDMPGSAPDTQSAAPDADRGDAPPGEGDVPDAEVDDIMGEIGGAVDEQAAIEDASRLTDLPPGSRDANIPRQPTAHKKDVEAALGKIGEQQDKTEQPKDPPKNKLSDKERAEIDSLLARFFKALENEKKLNEEIKENRKNAQRVPHMKPAASQPGGPPSPKKHLEKTDPKGIKSVLKKVAGAALSPIAATVGAGRKIEVKEVHENRPPTKYLPGTYTVTVARDGGEKKAEIKVLARSRNGAANRAIYDPTARYRAARKLY